MFVDICLPNGNEKEFVKIAERIGTRALLFLYKQKAPPAIKTKVTCFKGILVNKAIAVGDMLIVSDSPSREAIESNSIRVLFNFEKDKNKLNHIECRILKKRGKLIGIGFSNLLTERNNELLFGRLTDNIRLIRKYRLNLVLASFARAPYELRSESQLRSFGLCLGLTPVETKKALTALETTLKNS